MIGHGRMSAHEIVMAFLLLALPVASFSFFVSAFIDARDARATISLGLLLAAFAVYAEVKVAAYRERRRCR